jgi:hypothetical protein
MNHLINVMTTMLVPSIPVALLLVVSTPLLTATILMNVLKTPAILSVDVKTRI